MLVAFIVAAAEAGLYLIWDHRKSQTKTVRRRRPTAPRLSDSEEPVSPSDSMSPHVHGPFQIVHTVLGSGLKESPNTSESIQDTVTLASNVQTHQTADGLRARGQQQL